MESGTFMNYFIPTSYSYSIINNSVQDSAVLMESNGMVNVTQIYSFTSGTIDASLAIQNVNLYNTTFYSSFSIFTRHSRYVDLNGFSPEKQVMVDGMSGMRASAVPSTDWEASVGSISVNWMSELSIFHGGLIYSGNIVDFLILSFGPISIPANNTYSIDPLLSQNVPLFEANNSSSSGSLLLKEPSARAFYISPSPYPSITSFNVGVGTVNYRSVYYPGFKVIPSWLTTIPSTITPLYFNGSVYLGYGGDILTIYGITNGVGEPTYETLYSKSITSTSFSIRWIATPGIFKGFEAQIRNGYGSASSTFNHNLGIWDVYSTKQDNPGNHYANIYASNGSLVGYAAETFYGVNEGLNFNENVTFSLASSYVPLNSTKNYGMNFVSMNFTFVSDTIGKPIYLSQNPYSPELEDQSADQSTAATMALYESALKVSGIIPEIGIASNLLSDLVSPISNPSYYSNDGNGHNLFVIFNAGSHVLNPYDCGRYGGSYCDPIYNALVSPDSNEGNAYVASIYDNFEILSPLGTFYNYSNAPIDEFLYTSEVSVTTFAPYGLISTTVTEPIYMAQLS